MARNLNSDRSHRRALARRAMEKRLQHAGVSGQRAKRTVSRAFAFRFLTYSVAGAKALAWLFGGARKARAQGYSATEGAATVAPCVLRDAETAGEIELALGSRDVVPRLETTHIIPSNDGATK